MNKTPIAPATGLVLLILVLANIIFFREIYLGKTQWQFILLFTIPLLLFLLLKKQHQRRQENDATKNK